jgi:hypothetical protein
MIIIDNNNNNNTTAMETNIRVIIFCVLSHVAALSGFLATTTWRVLRLRMKEKALRYTGYLRIY